MIILPATGARQTRYFDFARFVAKKRWHVITLDYRGFGESKPGSAKIDGRYSMVSWGRYDLDACLTWAKERLGAQKITVLGHSIGGQIIPLASQRHEIDQVVGIATQKGLWKNWHFPRKFGIAAFFKVYVPVCLKLFGRVPLERIGLDDLPKEVARDYVRWTSSYDYTDDKGVSFLDGFHRFRAPILSLSFADDHTYAPKQIVDDLAFNYYRNAPVWRCHLTPQQLSLPRIGHSGFFNNKLVPEALWQDIVTWMNRNLDGSLDESEFVCLRDIVYRPGMRDHVFKQRKDMSNETWTLSSY